MNILISNDIGKESDIGVRFDIILRTYEASRFFLYHGFKGLISSIYFDDIDGESKDETIFEILKVGLENNLLPEDVWIITNKKVNRIRMEKILNSYSYYYLNSDNKFIKVKVN